MWLAASGLVLAGIISVFSISGASAAFQAQQAKRGHVRHVQAFEEERTGVSSPVGLAFSSATKAFYVLGGRRGGGGSLSEADVAKLTPFSHSPDSDRSGSARLAAAVQDPINIAFDPRGNRLLLLGHARELLEVRVLGAGDLDRGSLNRRDATRFELRDPQGMTVDPSSGVVYILDAGSSSIVRVEPDASGRFDTGTVSEIDLPPSGLTNVRGLAFDPATGNLQVGSGQTLYEVTTSGVVVSTRNLSGLEVATLEGMVFAPSGDLTDPASQSSLYVADSGTASGTGQIVELSLAAEVSITAVNFTSQLVRTLDMGTLSPPSPDPSGITYVSSTDRLLISDGEVEETVNRISHFQGANVWELNRNGLTLARTANVSKRAPIQVSMTDEPAGAGFNSANGHYLFAEDGGKRIYDLNPGGDGLITAGDSFTYFTTNGFGNTDPEGVTYNAVNGRLYVADGVNNEVYEYSTAGALLGHFDTQRYGVIDPEAVEANPQTGTLYTLSNRQSGPIIIETTTSGALIQTIDVSAAAGEQKPAGLAYANASNGSGVKRFYWVDRGIDNNNDPRAVDGKLYEMTTPGGGGPPPNQAPTVGAGPDQTITLPAPATLDGTVTDDGLPSPPGTVATTWTGTGPGTVTFGDASAVDTTATFTVAGTYVLRLTASDSALSSFDELTVTVEAGGGGGGQALDVRVNANQNDAEQRTSGSVSLANADLDMMSADESNTWVGVRFVGVAIPQGVSITAAHLQFQADEASSVGTSLTIRGEAADSSLVFANVSNDLGSRQKTAASQTWAVAPWVAVGNAGPAQRSPNLAAIIQEIVNRPGWGSGNALALFLGGSGQRVAVAHNQNPAAAPLLHVEWGPNQAPLVDAGPDQTITLPAGATLNATVTDDGLPTPPSLTRTWTQEGGTGTATFADASAEDTTVTFSQADTYVLRLTASDGDLSGFDELTVIVNPASPNTSEVRVSANPDDAEETTANIMQRGDGDLDMMNDSNGNKLVVGTRFQGVAIPPGATITNAYLQFQADEAHSVATNLTIRGQAADNPSVFGTTNGDLSSRPTTTASQTWTVDPWLAVGDAGTAQRSPNLAAIIQEIVSRPGWTSGNAVVLLITGSGQRVAVAHNQNPAAAPLLHVEWASASAASAYRMPSVGAGGDPDQAFADGSAVDKIAGFSLAGTWRLLFTFTFLGLVAPGIFGSLTSAGTRRSSDPPSAAPRTMYSRSI
jgi:hypothetical protein